VLHWPLNSTGGSVPVTAKLSRRFYEQLGDEIATELVDWFNAVDATYRSDLRDLNESNFARFETKLEQGVSTLEAKIDTRVSVLEAKVDTRLAALEGRMDTRFAEMGDRVTIQLSAFESRLMRWTIGLWTGTMLAFVGAIIAVLRLR
jgi:hypothetical protein